jgi:hypothetical protein
VRGLPDAVKGEIADVLGHDAAERGLDGDGTLNKLGRELDESADALGLEEERGWFEFC